MQAEFTADWFSKNVPHWNKWLHDFMGRTGLRILEIGSFEGRSTIWMIENLLAKGGGTIDCVDYFSHDPVHGDYHARFKKNTAAYADVIRELPGDSFDILRRLDDKYDIIYVDGCHTAFGVMTDGLLSWHLLKVGGVMIFDDYKWMPPRLASREKCTTKAMRKKLAAQTPKLGIDALLAALQGRYQLIGKGYQVAIRKTDNFDERQLRLSQAPLPHSLPT